MLAVQIQEEMRLVVEAQRTLEVQLQGVQKARQEAQEKEKNCDEDLVMASKDLYTVTSADVVSLSDFRKASDKVIKITDYRDQAQSLRLVLQANEQTMFVLKQQLQCRYDLLAHQLEMASNNILRFP